MKKKILFILTLVIVAVLAFGASASAYTPPDGEGSVDIELSDIELDGVLYVGQPVTISGTATITVTADAEAAWFWYSQAYTYAEVNYGIVGITGNTVTGEDYDDGFCSGAEAVITLVVPWEITQVFDDEGSYTAGHSAEGYWEWDQYFGWIHYSDDGSDSAVVARSFYVNGPSPEEFFRASILGTDGTASYGSRAMTPMPIQNDIVAVGQFFAGNGNFYKVVIPEGTVITNGSGEKALCVYINDIVGNTLYSTFKNMTFSNPVTVYVGEGDFVMNEFQQWEGGTWIELGSFAKIDENGQAILN